ncbi:hypothetical protein [Acidaminococcus timonensis]|uniref:hypothetical protein n=1 Tax=Acidaminococcus timonensis TaxID=1871002 RepID=UPI00307A01EB
MLWEAEDCIHLKACRRLKKLWHVKEPRGCNNNCSAYVSGNTGVIVTAEDAVNYARAGVPSIRSGYDPYDVYCTIDLERDGQTLGELIDELQKKTDSTAMESVDVR